MFAWQMVCLTKFLELCFEMLTDSSSSLYYKCGELNWILGELFLSEQRVRPYLFILNCIFLY